MNSELAPSMHSFKLYGKTRELFGDEFRMHVTTVHEAFRGLAQMVKGFGKHVKESEFRIILGDRDTGILLQTEQVGSVLPVGCDVHVVPALRGANGGSIGKIVVGAVLVVASFYTGGLATAGYLSATAAATLGQATLAVGMSLALSGAAMLLSPQAKTTAAQQQADQNSFNFSGVQNTNAQGVAVPVVYGEFEVGSVLISAGISTQQLMN